MTRSLPANHPKRSARDEVMWVQLHCVECGKVRTVEVEEGDTDPHIRCPCGGWTYAMDRGPVYR